MGGHPHMATSTQPHWGDSAATTSWQGGEVRMMQGVFGTVSAVDGTTLTVLGRSASSTATTTFSVDASNARIVKNSATSTASIGDIQIGDRILVQGPVTGTSVVAKIIIDGLPARMMEGRKPALRPGMMGSTTQRRVMMPRGFSAQEEGSESGSESASESASGSN